MTETTWVALAIAVIAAAPGVYSVYKQWKSRHINPIENGTDWLLNEYRTAAEEARAENAIYRAVYGPPPDRRGVGVPLEIKPQGD